MSELEYQLEGLLGGLERRDAEALATALDALAAARLADPDLVAAAVELPVLVAAAGRVVVGFGVTQQHQTAHGASRFVSSLQINVQAGAQDKVTSACWVRKKTI